MTDDDLYKLVDFVSEMDNGDTIAVYIKWHVDLPQARRILHSFCREEFGYDDDQIENLREPVHERWRKVPGRDEFGYPMFRFRKGTGRGAFPVTVINFQDWER